VRRGPTRIRPRPARRSNTVSHTQVRRGHALQLTIRHPGEPIRAPRIGTQPSPAPALREPRSHNPLHPLPARRDRPGEPRDTARHPHPPARCSAPFRSRIQLCEIA
jgi:hypothetical protein